ncbi:hypothetical protein [Acrocarpospora sp. B8E8]|uniref:hypothetical protein n=1 Tax=Acrocarpospora sp. B8E8 TaxID=3153572 RepID=UPI00325DC5AC
MSHQPHCARPARQILVRGFPEQSKSFGRLLAAGVYDEQDGKHSREAAVFAYAVKVICGDGIAPIRHGPGTATCGPENGPVYRGPGECPT